MTFTSEINIIKNLVREYSRAAEGLEGERIQHYGDIAIQKLRDHDFDFTEEEQTILLEAIQKFGDGLPLVRVTSLVCYPLG